MKDSDFIFEDTEIEEKKESELIGEFSVGDKVIVNGEDFEITEFVKAKEVGDNLGFPSIYSWYKAKNGDGELVNLFFFDSDIDSVEKNDKVSEEWFNQYGS